MSNSDLCANYPHCQQLYVCIMTNIQLYFVTSFVHKCIFIFDCDRPRQNILAHHFLSQIQRGITAGSVKDWDHH